MAIGNPINLTSNVEGKNISVIATAGQTQFTVTGGYRINQISVFRNGVRLVDGRDFTALDGTIVTLLSAATVADVIEFQVFDDFRVSDALSVNSGGTVNGNVTVTGILSTTNLSIGSSISLDATTGIITAVQVIGGTITGTATTAINAQGLTGTPDITVNNIVAAAGTFSGVLTYEDVTNIDSLGIVTARTGVDITANGLVVNAGVSTFAADLSIADKIVHTGDTNTALRFPSADTFTVETAGTQRLEVNSTGDLGLVGIATATGLVVVAGSGGYAGHTGIITAVTFDGALSGAATQVTVADESSDTTCFPLFATAATGDLAPKSGTNLTFNSSTGALTATSFVGAVTGAVTGNADTATTSTNVTVADESSDTTCFPLFATAATGNLPPKSGTNLTFNSSTGALTATSFAGNITGGTIAGSTGTFTGFVDCVRSASDGFGYLGIGPGGTDEKAAFVNRSGEIDLELYSNYSSSATVSINSDGTATFKGDLTIADKIIHDGDTNTAIRFPAVDTFSVETSGTERLRVDSSGRLLVTSGNASLNVSSFEPHIQVAGTTAEASSIMTGRFGNNESAPFFIFHKSRNASINGNTVVADDDILGRIAFYGADGTDYEEAAHIQCQVDGTPNDDATDMPGRLLFATTADGDHNATERLRIDSVGTIHFKNGLMIENGEVTATAATGTQNFDLVNGMVLYRTGASTGTWKPNFRVNGSVSVNSKMGTGDVISPTLIVAKGATSHYATTIQIDGSDVTPEFLGGAPSDGGGSGTFDIYSYTIIKTANATFKVFASVSNYE